MTPPRRWLQQCLHGFGVDVRKFPADRMLVIKRRALLDELGIDGVWDIGGSDGKYGRELRRDGYAGQIISCEPLPESYAKLKRAASDDAAWTCLPVAVGTAPGELMLHRSGNLDSSSLLPMEERHAQAAPQSVYCDNHRVPVEPLDALVSRHGQNSERLVLKIDVQGFEAEVLAGAETTLPKVQLVEIELSLVALYSGGPLFGEMHARLLELGLHLTWIEPGFVDHQRDEILQVECLYRR